MKIVNGEVIIEGLKAAMPSGEYVAFTDGDCTRIVIEKDVILRLVSLTEFEENRMKGKNNA